MVDAEDAAGSVEEVAEEGEDVEEVEGEVKLKRKRLVLLSSRA